MVKWLMNGREVSAKTPPETSYGFVYELVLKDGKRYLGKKSFWGTTKKKLTQKEIEDRPSKRHKTWKYVTKESKWRSYTSSSKLFGSREVVEKHILKVCKSKIDLTYWELAVMVERNVLFSDEYLNENLLGKFYKGKINK